MKKNWSRESLLLLTATLLSGLVFVGCGGGSDQITGETRLKFNT